MNNVDRFFQRSHYNIIRVLLSVCGIWPFHTVVRRYIIYFAIALVLGSGIVFEVHIVEKYLVLKSPNFIKNKILFWKIIPRYIHNAYTKNLHALNKIIYDLII